MTWVMLSLMYSFGVQSSRVAAILPPPVIPTVRTTGQTFRAVSNKPLTDVDFSLVVGGTLWRWDTLGLFMLPGESRTMRISSPDKDGGFVWDGAFSGSGERERTYTAPSQPGWYRAGISRGRHSKKINVFVMVPFRGQESVNGYKIGSYPKKSHFTKLSLPRGFIEVTGASANAWLSPHFRLKEFVCHQPSSFPKYVVLREGLIRKLEFLIARAQHQGLRCPGFKIISGYRTPYFNQANGNVENSVHTYGGAADIYIDANGDSKMDDLNKDGKVSIADATVLYNVADLLERENPEFTGGNGYYPGGSAHGPFIHTDVRGQKSRWHE